MRDAFGSTFMFRLIIIFIVFYVTFATIAVSYAKTYRIKNGLIDLIEQKEIKIGDSDFRNKVDTYLSKQHYHLGAVFNRAREDCQTQINDNNGVFTDEGACIVANGDHYVISVYIPIVMPVNLFSAVIPVRGETRNYHNNRQVLT